MKYDYHPAEIELKWQNYWDEKKSHKTLNDFTKPKFYVLDMFPYPSGAGLHVGHPEGYTATDIVSRYKKMNGYNVLHPMGWDAFGLPAERAAVRTGEHPAILTEKNIANFKRQINRLGLGYDWDREICTSKPDYYRWTQWIFLKLYEKGLAYLEDVPVNWCPAQQTVLANEEVVDGKYVETGDPVEKKVMRQWMLKITAYADQLLLGLDDLDWPKNVVEMQRNWIGKSQGLSICFQVDGLNMPLEVFTTRPETIMGATFCVVAPNHPILANVKTPDIQKAIDVYTQKVESMSDRDRQSLAGKEKTGLFTGLYVIHPITQKKLPIWVADYVKLNYGTGAVMAVPGHDERDAAFAEKFELPIIEVIKESKMIHSEHFDGLDFLVARAQIIDFLVDAKVGVPQTTYQLRDWLFSRQRYWGEPFPMCFNEQGDQVPVDAKRLPVVLPDLLEFKPTASGEPPLANAKDWLWINEGSMKLKRETNTMPQWAGSCWYYLRFMDPENNEAPFSFESQKYWGQVDLYVGGLEHAVSHLLYARFWHRVLYDCGLVSHPEPFKKLFNQGMILARSYRDSLGKYYHEKDVIEKDGHYTTKTGQPLTSMIEKMSKSKLNVVNPDDVVTQYGADSLRLYEMFMGPLDVTKPWQTNGVKGVYGFLQKVWRITFNHDTQKLSEKFVDGGALSPEALKVLHQTIHKVTQDIESMKFNTAIAQMMQFINLVKDEKHIPKDQWALFIQVLAPFAPHLAEEIWHALGHQESVFLSTWPVANPELLKEDSVDLCLCINGKKINMISAPKDLSQTDAEALFKTDEKIISRLQDKTLRKIILVPNRLINGIVN